MKASNRRLSAQTPDWTDEPLEHAIIIETIDVLVEHRQQGLCRAFINEVCADPQFDLVIVEGVGNVHLADALMRWGWDVDAVVMDFYKAKGGHR